MTENQETITLNEFKAWLVGLIRGKNGALPDLDDWNVIKNMIDKIVPETTIVKEKEVVYPSLPYEQDKPWYPTLPNHVWYDNTYTMEKLFDNWNISPSTGDKT